MLRDLRRSGPEFTGPLRRGAELIPESLECQSLPGGLGGQMLHGGTCGDDRIDAAGRRRTPGASVRMRERAASSVSPSGVPSSARYGCCERSPSASAASAVRSAAATGSEPGCALVCVSAPSSADAGPAGDSRVTANATASA